MCDLVVMGGQVSEIGAKEGVIEGVMVDVEVTEVDLKDRKEGVTETVGGQIAVTIGAESTGRISGESLGRLC